MYGIYQDFLTLWKQADTDVPLLKRRKPKQQSFGSAAPSPFDLTLGSVAETVTVRGESPLLERVVRVMSGCHGVADTSPSRTA